MRAKYGFNDSERNRKHWEAFQKHRNKCRAKAAERHKLFLNNRSQWEKEISALPVREKERQIRLAKRKADLLSKLKR